MSKCKSCKYRAAKDKPWECEYISIIGHSRGCEPGDDCTVYKKGRRIVVPNNPMKIVGYSAEKDLLGFLERFNHYN